MKSLVVYSSQTGNTRKLAEAVYEVLPGKKEIYPIDGAPDPSGYDFIAFGFWLLAGKPDPEALDYLPKIKGCAVFLFASHGAAVGSTHAQNAMEYAKNLLLEADFVGSYSCQGEIAAEIVEKAKSKPEPPDWLAGAAAAVGHPDETDIEKLKRIVASITAELGSI
jgi:flavodoxin